jgi:hypothetical protein
MAEKLRRKPSTKTKLTDKAQSERFKETARKRGVQENEDFAEILKKVATANRPLKSSASEK